MKRELFLALSPRDYSTAVSSLATSAGGNRRNFKRQSGSPSGVCGFRDDGDDHVPGCEECVGRIKPRSRRMYKYTYSECTKRFPEISRDRTENFVACVCELGESFSFSLRFNSPLSISVIQSRFSLSPYLPPLALSFSFPSLSRTLARSARHVRPTCFPSTFISLSRALSLPVSLLLLRHGKTGFFPSLVRRSPYARECGGLLASVRLCRRCRVAARNSSRRCQACELSAARRAVPLPCARSRARSISLGLSSLAQPGSTVHPPPPTADIPTAVTPPPSPLRLFPVPRPAARQQASLACALTTPNAVRGDFTRPRQAPESLIDGKLRAARPSISTSKSRKFHLIWRCGILRAE